MKVVGNKKVRAAVALIASLAFNTFSGLPPAGIPTAMAAGEANSEKPPTREALMNVVDILQNAAADIRSTMMATEYVEPSNDDSARTLEEGPATTVFGPKPVIPTTTSTSTPPSGDEFSGEGPANSADHIPSSSVPPTDPFKSFGSKADYGTNFFNRFDILRYATADIRSTMMATEYVEPSNDDNAKTLEEGPATTVFGPKPVIPTTTTTRRSTPTSTPPSGDEFVGEGSANSADHIPSSSVPSTDSFESFGSKSDDETSFGFRLIGIISHTHGIISEALLIGINSRIYDRDGLPMLFVLALFALFAFALIVSAVEEFSKFDQLHTSTGVYVSRFTSEILEILIGITFITSLFSFCYYSAWQNDFARSVGVFIIFMIMADWFAATPAVAQSPEQEQKLQKLLDDWFAATPASAQSPEQVQELQKLLDAVYRDRDEKITLRPLSFILIIILCYFILK